ncbi:MAG: 7-cyano-7-deazaguanine synthase QueC [Legionellales bacterium]|nr:7-cyano-7-deazaguanine synthase QueC [Legionellales bacterium]|tara:strand:- start:10439 stop:11116 length:678 start_codon:yes stop_codon:yes gene_type:complete
MSRKAIIVLSGGLDSTTCLGLAKQAGCECYALTFHYGQKHSTELRAAERVCQAMGVFEHKVLALPIGELGGSALTDVQLSVPDYAEDCNEIPITYVPARNTIFLTFALAWAEVIGANDIFIGASSVDYSGYPDCRPEYFQAFERVAKLATKAGVEGSEFTIHTPLLQLSKAQTIQQGLACGVDYSLTVSCYRADNQGLACGNCDSCHYRKKGFLEANIPDPTLYQ